MALVVLPNGMIREAIVGLSRGPISLRRSNSSSIDLMSVSAVEMRLALYSIVVAAENTASIRGLGAFRISLCFDQRLGRPSGLAHHWLVAGIRVGTVACPV